MQRDIADPPATTELQTEALAPGPAHPNGELPPPRGRWSPRRALLLEGLIVYVVLQLLTYPFLPAVRDRGQAFYNDVLLGFFGPEKHGLARILRSGILPAWVNDQYGGEPFVANLQHAVFYPGNLPFWLLKTSLAIDVVCAFHVAFAGLGMWAYSRFALRTSRWGAALAGLAFGFGSVTLQHIILMNQLEVIAWMPVVLLFGHLALERRQLRWVLLTGVAVGMQLLAGHPEEWVYTLLTLAIYGAGWVLVANPRQWPRRGAGGVRAAVRLAAPADAAAAALRLPHRSHLQPAVPAAEGARLQRPAPRLRPRAHRRARRLHRRGGAGAGGARHRRRPAAAAVGSLGDAVPGGAGDPDGARQPERPLPVRLPARPSGPAVPCARQVPAADLLRDRRGVRARHGRLAVRARRPVLPPARRRGGRAGRARGDPRHRAAVRRGELLRPQPALVGPGGAGRGGRVGGGQLPDRAAGADRPAADRGDRGRAAPGSPGRRVPRDGPRRGLRRPRPDLGASRPGGRPLRHHRLRQAGHGAAARVHRHPARPDPDGAELLRGDLAAPAGRPARLGVRDRGRDDPRPRRRADAAAQLPAVLQHRGRPAGAARRRPHPPGAVQVELAGARLPRRALVRDPDPPEGERGSGPAAARVPGRRAAGVLHALGAAAAADGADGLPDRRGAE